ncbi:MAG: 5'/3'-nucleotidase SurE [Thermodesulfobacteriota bacterium]
MAIKDTNILVSNDDGISSEGIIALAKALKPLGEIFVVAPDRERSAASHSLTLHRPLRVEKIGNNLYAVNGTPTDCINLAVNGLLPVRPHIIVSGINKGCNLGHDITYSGTVSAAMEGVLLGIPSLAISLVSENNADFGQAANFAARITSFVLKNGLPRDTLLNINVPAIKDDQIKGFRITKQGTRIYEDCIVEKVDPRGKKYYWIGGNMLRWKDEEDTDFRAIDENYISITPLHLDMTNYSSFEEVLKWKF